MQPFFNHVSNSLVALLKESDLFYFGVVASPYIEFKSYRGGLFSQGKSYSFDVGFTGLTHSPMC